MDAVSPPAGDPASCSATAAALRRVGLGLRSDARMVHGSYADLGGRWSGRAAVLARQRGDAVVGAGEAVAESLDTVATALQRHAAELASLLDEVADLSTTAGAQGLVVTDAGVRLAPGIRGVADGPAAAATEVRRVALDARLAELRARHAATAAGLTALVAESSTRLAALSASLRLG